MIFSKRLILVLAILTLVFPQKTSSMRPISTYSIVALDETTGELGVAVQSHWFSVGFLVPWAKACLLYTSPSPRDRQKSRMPSSA